MLFSGICGRNHRRFRFKINSGQGYACRKNNNFIDGNADNIGTFRDAKKPTLIIILAIVWIFFSTFLYSSHETAFADSDESDGGISESITKVLETLNLDDLEDLFAECDLFSGSLIYNLIELINGNAENAFENFFENFLEKVKNRLFSVIPLCVTLLSIVILLAVIESVNSERLDNSVASLTSFIGNLAIIGVVLGYFVQEYATTSRTINTLTKEIEVAFPVILTLMTAYGGTATVSVFKPSSVILCNGVSLIFCNILLPITIMIFVFNAINCFSQKVKTDKTVDFLKSGYKWIVGLSGVFFCFFITAQGIASSTYDNLSLKAIKYAMSSSLPLINSLIAGGFDVVVASCVLVKNALGILTLILLLNTVATPLVGLVVLSLLLKLIAGLIQSITNERTVKFLSGTADCVSYLATTLVGVSIAYMVMVLVAISSMGAGF